MDAERATDVIDEQFPELAPARVSYLGEGELDVARYMAACRGAMDVAFGLDHGRSEYVTTGIRALESCTL